MSPVAEQHCVPCASGGRPLKGEALEQWVDRWGEGWMVIDGKRLEKKYTFGDFHQALDFVNRVGAVAEEKSHHPDIYLTYGKAMITLWTHQIKGLHENDFIMAAKIDCL
jgi:4a-hydroxytetrahydrobiopterin dehydratase